MKWKGQEEHGEKSEKDRGKRRTKREEGKGESPFREKRCWNAATEEEEERTKSERATRRTELGGERWTSDEETKKERIELLPTQRLSYLMIYSAVPESR